MAAPINKAPGRRPHQHPALSALVVYACCIVLIGLRWLFVHYTADSAAASTLRQQHQLKLQPGLPSLATSTTAAAPPRPQHPSHHGFDPAHQQQQQEQQPQYKKPHPMVVAIMAVWDEALTIPLAIDSTRHFVNEYIVINKPGSDNTSAVLSACRKKWSLRMRYIESNMTLKAARRHAIQLSAAYADIYVIQDGDEVFYDAGPTAIQQCLHVFASGYYQAIYSKMVYLKYDLKTTVKDRYRVDGTEDKWGGHMGNGIMLVPHLTVFLNRPERIVDAEEEYLDVPKFLGPSLVTHDPWKFDVSIKSKLREMLRNYFMAWTAAGSPGTIEEWARTKPGFHLALINSNRSNSLEQSAEIFYRQMQRAGVTQPYNESMYHKYPRVIRKYVDAGMLRGYECAGEIL